MRLSPAWDLKQAKSKFHAVQNAQTSSGGGTLSIIPPWICSCPILSMDMTAFFVHDIHVFFASHFVHTNSIVSSCFHPILLKYYVSLFVFFKLEQGKIFVLGFQWKGFRYQRRHNDKSSQSSVPGVDCLWLMWEVASKLAILLAKSCVITVSAIISGFLVVGRGAVVVGKSTCLETECNFI